MSTLTWIRKTPHRCFLQLPAEQIAATIISFPQLNEIMPVQSWFGHRGVFVDSAWTGSITGELGDNQNLFPATPAVNDRQNLHDGQTFLQWDENGNISSLMHNRIFYNTWQGFGRIENAHFISHTAISSHACTQQWRAGRATAELQWQLLPAGWSVRLDHDAPLPLTLPEDQPLVQRQTATTAPLQQVMPAQQQPLTAQHLLIRDAAGDIGWSLMTENMLSITTTAALLPPQTTVIWQAWTGAMPSMPQRIAPPRRHDHTTTAATLAPASRHLLSTR